MCHELGLIEICHLQKIWNLSIWLTWKLEHETSRAYPKAWRHSLWKEEVILWKTIANSSKKSWVLIKEIKETANRVGGQMDAPKQIGKHVTTQRSHCQYL
jgi:hypothetical protein